MNLGKDKLRLAILANEVTDDHALWEKACLERADIIHWEVINLTHSDWLEKITRFLPDGLLAKPPAYSTPFKIMYDERVAVLNQVCSIPVYPSLEEIQVYENKKLLSYWLAANQIPHPATHVFYHLEEALDFVAQAKLPLVGKTNIGASGRGVIFLKSRTQAAAYVRNIFSGKGATRSIGPNWRKKGFLRRVIHKLFHPQEINQKLKLYRQIQADVQKDFVILQDFVPHEYEWRCVRIGDSFFAHKKMVVGEKASGSLIKGYETPPASLLDFLKQVTDRRGFLSQAVDVFETEDGQYLVNEMQCIFGQSDPYQMLVENQPGRYLYNNGKWIFDSGDFNRHESYLLRLDHFIKILQNRRVIHRETSNLLSKIDIL